MAPAWRAAFSAILLRMSAWARRRKLVIIGGFLLLVLAGTVPLVRNALKREPTCFDGIQNGAEAGVDCGGPCQYLCTTQVAPLSVQWSRAFPVTRDSYHAVAYVENPNTGAAVREIGYIFRLYDKDNILITERAGRTFIAAGGITPIFEPRIFVGNRPPVRTLFEFTEEAQWERPQEAPPLSVERQRLTRPIPPRIDAVLRNGGFSSLKEVPVVAVVFNVAGNAIAASQTVVPSVPAQGTVPIFFTWLAPFGEEVGRIEIIPRIPPRMGAGR